METTISTKLAGITCPSCGGVYAIAAEYKEEAQRLGSFQKCWTCPYCKTERGYGESAHSREKKRLEAELAAAKNSALVNASHAAKAREQRDSALKEAEHFRHSRDGVKGVLAKERKRVGNGICPCCNRSFSNLQRHMHTQHPDYGHADVQNNPVVGA